MLFKLANVVTGGGSEAEKQDEGASLTSILETPMLRVELALLVLLCTDTMRNDLLATFDPTKTHDTTKSGPAAFALSPQPKLQRPAHDLISFDEPQDAAALAAKKAHIARQSEIESTQIQALRRSALTYFDKWRQAVMNRICEVLCVRGDVVRQAKAKRKQVMEEADRQKQGNSLLIDIGGDPFRPETFASESKRSFDRYEVIETKLLSFQEEKKVMILHCLLLLLLSLENYPAHSRVLLLHLASSLKLERDLLAEHEKSVAQGLLATAASQMDAEESTKKQTSNDAASRKWKVGLAAVGGAVLIGVTGGLAAPLLAAGIGTVMGGLGLGVVSTYLGALAGSSVLVGSLFGAYGAKMTGKIMEQYAREVQDFEFIPVQDPDKSSTHRENEWAEEQDARDPAKRERHRLRVTIGISGWLSSPSDVNKPWEIIDASGPEPFALRFELDALLRMGNSLNDVLFSYAWDGVTYTIVSRTLLGALYAGLWPLGLVKLASVLDNPFSVALARADKAGKVLAHALIDGVQGKRPVTLIGYSIGARVIYSCLVELAEQHAFGLVESVVLMGAPAPSDSRSWRLIRSVVVDRVVNVYSTEDYILGFLYRSAKLEFGVAGLRAVQDVYGIENVDVSKLVNGHDKYRYLVGTILAKINFGDIDFNRVADQERALELTEKKKKEAREKLKRQQQQSHKSEPLAQATTEVAVVLSRSSTLSNMPDTSRPLASQKTVPQLPPQRSITSQPRSGQQPQIQLSTAVPVSAQVAQKPAQHASTIEIDPPSGTIQTHDHHIQDRIQGGLPMSAPVHTNQIPSNMAPTTPAPGQRTNFTEPTSSDDEDYKVSMHDLEAHEVSPPPVEALKTSIGGPPPANAPKGVPAAMVAEVNACADSDTEDEVSSEFGGLSMVEPMPMDDNDYGLM